MIWLVAAGGTARRYCRECGDPLPVSMAAEAVFCSGRCRSRQWRRLQRTRQRVIAMQRGKRAECPVCGRSWTGGAVEVGGVLLGPLPGTGLPPEAGVAEGCYGNAVAERLAVTTNTACCAGVLAVVGGCFERPHSALCLRVSRPRHRGW